MTAQKQKLLDAVNRHASGVDCGHCSGRGAVEPVDGSATPLGQLLIDAGLIGPKILNARSNCSGSAGEKLGRILVDMGYLAQRDLLAALSEQLGLPIAQLAAPAFRARTRRACRRASCASRWSFRVAIDEGALTLAMADPLDFETINAVQSSSKLEVSPQLATEQEILDAIDRYYTEGDRQSAAADFGAATKTISNTCAIWRAKRPSSGW